MTFYIEKEISSNFLSIELFQSLLSFVFKKLLSVVSDLDTFHRDLGLGMGGAPRFFGSAVLREIWKFHKSASRTRNLSERRQQEIVRHLYRPAVHKDMFM